VVNWVVPWVGYSVGSWVVWSAFLSAEELVEWLVLLLVVQRVDTRVDWKAFHWVDKKVV
jgi:hypothetical protein